MGNGISFSFSFDDHLFVWTMLALLAGTGVAACLIGALMLALARSRQPRWGSSSIHGQLASWGLMLGSASAAGVERDVLRTWRKIRAYALIGAGVGVFAGVAAVAAGSLAATGDILGVSALPAALSGFVYFTLLLGLASGYTLGIWRLKRAADRLAYADLRRRRLSDYRGGLLFWLPTAIIAAEAVLTAVILPNLSASLRVELDDGEILRLPGAPLVVWALPVAMLLILVTSEVLLRRVAALPRLLVTADPEAARRADEMMRAQMISTMERSIFFAFGLFVAAQWSLLSQQITSTNSLRPLLDVTLLLASVTWALSVLAALSQGRLGGGKTGWPWRPATAQ